VVETVHRPTALVNSDRAEAPLAVLGMGPVAAFCGIGNPEAFRRTLEGLGSRLGAFRTFPDHHAYTRSDVEDLRGWAQRQEDGVVVTTQKDLVKLRLTQLGNRPLWALQIRLHVEAGQDVLDRKLCEALNGRCAPV
jgi:tetraacyldisaccharide 4'-kinase